MKTKAMVTMAILCALLGVVAAVAPTERQITRLKHFEGQQYEVLEVGTDLDALQLYWQDDSGVPIGKFSILREIVARVGKQLHFATNAGIFEPGQIPTGLHVQDGELLRPLNLDEGEGNFYLKPNGVFWVDDDGPGICASEAFAPTSEFRLACQSGPLLLDAGEIHPAFAEDSTHRFTRSGVGITQAGEVVFAISESRVSLYAFAKFFRDALDCPDALYLDGAISRFYTQGDQAADRGDFAGIFAIVGE